MEYDEQGVQCGGERPVSIAQEERVSEAHLTDRVGRAQGWNFEKAHSILHKVHDIVMWGWSENTSCQGPEH